MKNFKSFLLWTIAACMSISVIHGQTKQLQEVTADLGSGVFSGTLGLPFDVPFRIKGTTTPNLRSIELIYQVSSTYKDSNKLIWKGNATAKKYATWNYMGDQPEWRLTVGPIHPNVPYEFTFKITRKPDVKGPEMDKFKAETYRILQAYFDDPKGITPVTIFATNLQLNMMLRGLIPPGQNIIYPNGKLYTVDINEPPFSNLLETVKDAKRRELNLNNRLNFIRAVFATADYNGFRLNLAGVVNNPALLKPAGKTVLDGAIDPGNPKYKGVKMIDLANIVMLPGHRLDDVYEGKLTLNNNNSWVITNKPDVELMQLIYQFFYKLESNLDLAAGSTVFDANQISVIQNLLPRYKSIIDGQVFNSELEGIKTAALAKFPDVLADKLLSATYIVNDQSFIDAVSQNTPYIGLDVGLSYIPGYSQLFAYEGVNIYFMPVNKDAPLSSFTKRRYWWAKRLSVHLGLTQSLIKVNNNRYQALIDGVGSILAGAGLRINRIMRLNAGYMFFYEKDNNPLKDEKHFTALPQFSITFDINIAKALGGFGARLHLGQ